MIAVVAEAEDEIEPAPRLGFLRPRKEMRVYGGLVYSSRAQLVDELGFTRRFRIGGSQWCLQES